MKKLRVTVEVVPAVCLAAMKVNDGNFQFIQNKLYCFQKLCCWPCFTFYGCARYDGGAGCPTECPAGCLSRRCSSDHVTINRLPMNPQTYYNKISKEWHHKQFSCLRKLFVTTEHTPRFNFAMQLLFVGKLIDDLRLTGRADYIYTHIQMCVRVSSTPYKKG